MSLRSSVRGLRRDWRTTSVAIATIGLAIGLGVSIDGFLRGTVFQRLPVPAAEDLVMISREPVGGGLAAPARAVDLLAWRQRSDAFAAVGAARLLSAGARIGAEPALPVAAAAIDVEGLLLGGAEPRSGRLFSREETSTTGAPPADVVLLREDLAETLFGSAEGALGRLLRVGSRTVSVVGVLPRGFGFPLDQELWLPLGVDPTARPAAADLLVFGRLAPGTPVAEATRRLRTLATHGSNLDPDLADGWRPLVEPYHVWAVGSDVHLFAHTMIGAVVLVLLVACVNVANLLLARISGHRDRLGIRCALGATRARLVGGQLGEAALLALAGGLLGGILGALGIRLLDRLTVDNRPFYWLDIRIDPGSFVALTAMIGLATLAVAALPALFVAAAEPAEVLGRRTRGGTERGLNRFTGLLVASELVLTMVLMSAAGITIESVARLATRDWGLPVASLATGRLVLPAPEPPDEGARRTTAALWKRVEDDLRAHPEIAAATLSSTVPVGFAPRTGFEIQGRETPPAEDRPTVRRAVVSPSFFAVLGRPIRAGRPFLETDDDLHRRVAIVNEALARKWFGSVSPLGRRIRLGDRGEEGPWLEVVGVAPDLWLGGPRNQLPDGVYLPVAQEGPTTLAVVAATRSSGRGLEKLLREVATRVSDQLVVDEVMPLETWIARRSFLYRLLPSIFVAFGGAGLFLAALGLYAVTSTAVRLREREIGVRLALGATPSRVWREIVARSGRQILLFGGLGIVLAAGFNSGLGRFLVETDPRDPKVLGLVWILLVAAGLVAVAWPARAVTRVEAASALGAGKTRR